MRRFLLAGLALIFVSAQFLPPTAAAPRQPPPRGPLAKPANLAAYAPDEVLVAFRPGIRPDVAAQAVGARISGEIQGLGVHILKVPPGTVEATVRAFDRNPLVEFAEPNGTVYAFVDPDDPYDNTICYPASDGACVMQWGWSNVRAYDAWAIVQGSATVKVAVVDTGMDIAWASGLPENTPHEDLGLPCIASHEGRSWVSSEPRYIDDHSHGTHVGGTIGACTNNALGVAGANWRLHFIVEKTLDFTGSGYWSWVAKGITDAADRGAKAINLSLGGSTGSKTLRRAVDYAWNRGAVLVCAAGNTGNTARSYPAYYTNCLAVAAVDNANQRPSWSTYGSWVEVAAPGVAILSLMQDQCDWSFMCWWEGYKEGYDSLSGTSMATAFVTGLAALIWSTGRCATNTCVRSIIENNTDPVGTWVSKGRVNFLKALSAAQALP